jgi:hypothetical protein
MTDGPAQFLLEYRMSSAGTTDLARMHNVLLHALERLATASVSIRYIHGLFVPDDKRCLYLLNAADPATIARAGDIAGLPLTRVQTVIDLASLPQPGARHHPTEG